MACCCCHCRCRWGCCAAQVVDGRLVVDVSSLTVQAQRSDVATFTRVEEDVRFVNARTYSKRLPTVGWAPHVRTVAPPPSVLCCTDTTAFSHMHIVIGVWWL